VHSSKNTEKYTKKHVFMREEEKIVSLCWAYQPTIQAIYLNIMILRSGLMSIKLLRHLRFDTHPPTDINLESHQQFGPSLLVQHSKENGYDWAARKYRHSSSKSFLISNRSFYGSMKLFRLPLEYLTYIHRHRI